MSLLLSVCCSFRQLSLIRPQNMQIMMKQSKIPKEKPLAPLYSPRTNAQKNYVKAMNDPENDLILGVGPAGTGKTLFACSYAVQEMKKGNINNIVITRPIVPVEEDIGYLPGKLNNKMEPWVRPIFDILGEYYNKKDINDLLYSGRVEIAPLAYMRGRTFKNSVIIADEMQNSTPNQMLMMTTRIGDKSKLILTGDLKQSDRIEDNGLKELLNKINTYKGDTEGIALCTFSHEDIQRSKIVTKILDLYENKVSINKEKITKQKIKTKIEESLKEQDKRNSDAAIIPKRDMERMNKKNI
jgi:phosphate starvation-inducible protein PhoH and related proteins